MGLFTIELRNQGTFKDLKDAFFSKRLHAQNQPLLGYQAKKVSASCHDQGEECLEGNGNGNLEDLPIKKMTGLEELLAPLIT